MGYVMECSCGHQTGAANIVDLIRSHTDPQGWLVCGQCNRPGAYIQRRSELQEGELWERCIKGAIPVETDYPTYTPYVFLTAASPTDEPTGVHFNYYKDTRSDGGRLKHGHGPGGAPVLSLDELLQLLRKLGRARFLTPEHLEQVASEIRNQAG